MLSLFSAIRNGELAIVLYYVIARCIVVFVCLPVHELCHGLAAYKFGDDTAKKLGRLTFNPFAHLDPIGTLMIFFFGIGYAKPVPINPLKFKDYRRDTALTALAGPLSNVAMAFIAAFISSAISFFFPSSTVAYVIAFLLELTASINISLAVFNLIPIPPLDGSRVLGMILPDRLYEKYFRYERYIMIALMVLLFTGALNTPIAFLSNVLSKFIFFIPNLIFG